MHEICLLDVLNFLKKYIKMILLITFISGVLSAAVTMRIPNVYTASLKMIPPPQPPASIIQMVLESQRFANILVRRFNLTQAYGVDSLNKARDQLMAQAHIKSNRDATITVEVDDVDPKRAAALANAYPEELNKFMVSIDLGDAPRQRKKIELQLDSYNDQLDIINKKIDAAERNPLVNKMILTAEKDKRRIISLLMAQLDNLGGDVNSTKVMPGLDRLRELLDRHPQPVLANATKALTQGERDYLENFGKAIYLKASIETLKSRQSLLKIDEQANAIQVLDEAAVPERKSKPKRLVTVVSTMLAVGFLSILLMLLIEFVAAIRKQTFKTAPEQ